MDRARVVVVVPARDLAGVRRKIAELSGLGLDYLIVCGERTDLPNTVYRPPAGKFDALNAGIALALPRADIVVLNDVDTRIDDLEGPLELIRRTGADMVFCGVEVSVGPQQRFYRLMDLVRRYLLIAATGEMVLVRAGPLAEVMPFPPTMAEDTWLLFKFQERGRATLFWDRRGVSTNRTTSRVEEAAYKRRTVCGIYQALSRTRPGTLVTLFYGILPFAAPALLVTGADGRAWCTGIWRGLGDFLSGTKGGSFDRIGRSPPDQDDR